MTELELVQFHVALTYGAAFFFLFLMVFNLKGIRAHWVILFLAFAINIILHESKAFDGLSNETAVVFSYRYDGLAAILLTLCIFDRLAKYQALILVFAIFCHFSVLLKVNSSEIGALYEYTYQNYAQILVTLTLLQMVISSGDFIRSFSALLSYIRTSFISGIHWNQDRISNKKREKSA